MSQLAIHKIESGDAGTCAGLSASKYSILKVLTYFDIFHYPLTADEIKQFMEEVIGDATYSGNLEELIEQELIFYYNGFYTIQDNPLLSHRRKQGNKAAETLLLKARRIGRFLYRFPFVRGIGVSGSLSKNYADEKADIDFFIITKPNRLWVARSLMHLYKKFTFLFGRQHYYCMNYYVDETALQLEDQNIFTAIEIKTLLPIAGEKIIRHFTESNRWASQLLPGCPNREQHSPDPGNSWIKAITEWLLKGNAGVWMDNRLFRLTAKRWKGKEEKGRVNKKGQTMELITGKHFARSNPGAFQEKVLALYEEKLRRFK